MTQQARKQAKDRVFSPKQRFYLPVNFPSFVYSCFNTSMTFKEFKSRLAEARTEETVKSVIDLLPVG